MGCRTYAIEVRISGEVVSVLPRESSTCCCPSGTPRAEGEVGVVGASGAGASDIDLSRRIHTLGTGELCVKD